MNTPQTEHEVGPEDVQNFAMAPYVSWPLM